MNLALLITIDVHRSLPTTFHSKIKTMEVANDGLLLTYSKEILESMNASFMNKIKAAKSNGLNGFGNGNSSTVGLSSSSGSSGALSLKNTCIDYLIHDQIQRKRFRSVLFDGEDDEMAANGSSNNLRINKRQRGSSSSAVAKVKLFSFGSGDCGQLG